MATYSIRNTSSQPLSLGGYTLAPAEQMMVNLMTKALVQAYNQRRAELGAVKDPQLIPATTVAFGTVYSGTEMVVEEQVEISSLLMLNDIIEAYLNNYILISPNPFGTANKYYPQTAVMPSAVSAPTSSAPPPNTLQYPAAGAIGGHRLVIVDTNSRAAYAGNDQLPHVGRVVGISTGAVADGALVTIQIRGEMTEPTWAWNLTLPVYLGVNGLLTQAQPTGPTAKFSQIVAFPLSATKLFVNLREPILIS